MMNQIIEGEGMLPLGTLLSNGKYRIEGYLSSGGFGNTYIATNMAFDEKVAIKELFMKGVCGRQTDGCSISISLTENRRTFEAQQEKFRKEARRLRRLNNGHIVRVHDLFDDNGTSYYVMDLIDGESLSKRMKRTGKPLTEQELMRILPQVLDALKTVHHEGIWHLDLKPSNIMLDKKGNAVLIDFGASKQLRNADGNSMSTSSALAYTPGFAPSEQMEQNMDKFGPWTDLYALGATMFNLLTKQQPPSPSDIDEDAESALSIPSSVSKKTHDLILWLMKPNRRMRPQSVNDVIQFLDETTSPSAPAGKKVEIKEKEKEKEKEIKEDDTRIKQPSSQPCKADKVSSLKKNRNVKWKKPLVAIITVLLWVGGLSFLYFNKEEANLGESPSIVADDDLQKVESAIVKVSNGPQNMRQYTFTGNVDKQSLPQGNGEAKFKKYGDIPASTYHGGFHDGLPHGEGVLEFSSGDKYNGMFENGWYKTGTYKLSDGSYFEGEFKEGSPWNGTWFDSAGNKDADVKNGKEV